MEETAKIVIEDLDKLQQDFAASMADTQGLLRSASSGSANADTATINNQFLDPEGNFAELGSLVESYSKTNGIIGGTIKYLQSHLTYNHSIYPTMDSKSGYEMPTDNSEYIEVARNLDLYNIKYYAPYFLKATLKAGVSFFYKIQNNKGIAYLEFPSAWGRIYEISDNVFRWELDMSKLSTDMVGLPSEIQNALGQYALGNVTEEKKWSEEKWYKLGDKGVAFALDQSVLKTGTQISELSSTLIEAIQLDKAKKNVEILDSIDAIRLVHSEIPIDKDGKPQMSSKVAKIYDRQFKNSLPKGIAGITSPMKITNVPLNGSGNSSSYDMIKKAQEQLFMSTGAPSNLFGGDTTSFNIVKMSVQKDANWLYTSFLTLIENYYNYEMAKFKTTSGMKWKINFIRQSHYSLKEDVALMEKQLTLGGSRLNFLAAIGMTPLQVYTMLNMEQKMLNIDSFMLPKSTSFTMSGSDKTGRPEAEEPTDDTLRIEDSK